MMFPIPPGPVTADPGIIHELTRGRTVSARAPRGIGADLPIAAARNRKAKSNLPTPGLCSVVGLGATAQLFCVGCRGDLSRPRQIQT